LANSRDNIIVETEANSAVKANPVVEVNIQGAEFTNLSSDNAAMSNVTTSQLQDLFAAVMAAIQTESNKQTAAFQTEIVKMTETLKAQFQQENEKLAASLTERFEAANGRLREEFNVKLQQEIQGVSKKVDTLSSDIEHEIVCLNKSVEDLSEGLSQKLHVHIVQTRKEFDKQGQEIVTSSKTMSATISEHKAQIDASIANLRQEIGKSQDQVDKKLNTMSDEIKSNGQVCESRVQREKQATDLEVMRLSKAVSVLEAKFTAGLADRNTSIIQQTTGIRTTAVGQTESTGSTMGLDARGLSVNVASEANTCSISTGSDNVNVVSGRYANNTDLRELTLPTFTDSTSQVPLHFIRDLDLYFSLKRTPEEMRLALVFRAVTEPFAKQWLASAFDKLTNYEEFKKAFTELLWCPSRQASIRSSIYMDRHDGGSGESCLDHYIRYANMASTLNPPMSDLDLLSALTSHFEPHVQQGLICSNLHSTQDAIAFLAKLEALENPKRAFRSQRREYDRRDMNRRNQYDHESGRNRDRGNNVNVRYVSNQAGRNRQWESNRAQGREQSRGSHRRSQGSVAAENSGRLNPEASQFNPFLSHDETSRETTGNSRNEGVTTVSLNN
jgi:hypothetical protein